MCVCVGVCVCVRAHVCVCQWDTAPHIYIHPPYLHTTLSLSFPTPTPPPPPPHTHTHTQHTHTHTHSLPLIVTTFNATTALREAVKREVERWQNRGLRYFSSGSCRDEEIEELGTALKDLQLKR